MISIQTKEEIFHRLQIAIKEKKVVRILGSFKSHPNEFYYYHVMVNEFYSYSPDIVKCTKMDGETGEYCVESILFVEFNTSRDPFGTARLADFLENNNVAYSCFYIFNPYNSVKYDRITNMTHNMPRVKVQS